MQQCQDAPEHYDQSLARGKISRFIATVCLALMPGALFDLAITSAASPEPARPFAGPSRGEAIRTANSISLPIAIEPDV